MKIFVFEEDPALMHLLTMYLQNLGHHVEGFRNQYSCPLYQQETCTCPADQPCAEAVLVNARLPDQEKIQMLVDQVEKGCKLPSLNKAVMSASTSEQQELHIRSLGFSVIKKPFRLATVSKWLSGCAMRLKHA